MNELIFKRRAFAPYGQRKKIDVSKESYKKITEIARESRMGLSAVLNKMVEFAYENVRYEEETENE